MSHAKRLESASGIFFFCGFVCSKLEIIPLEIIKAIFNLISVLLYFTGYLLWFIASQLHPHSSRKMESWYGFSEFKRQHQIAAIIGTAAVLFCIVSLIFSFLTIPASWFFVFSNCVWCIAEYHKYMHPPQNDPNYSPLNQKYYLKYSLVMTSISFVSAIATTLVLSFPPIAVPTIVIAGGIGIVLGMIAVNYWLKYIATPKNPTPFLESSKLINQKLYEKSGHRLENDPGLEEESYIDEAMTFNGLSPEEASSEIPSEEVRDKLEDDQDTIVTNTIVPGV